LTAIDTNVLLDIVEDDAGRAQSGLAALDAAARAGALIVAPAVYAELRAHPGWSAIDLDRYLSALGVHVDWQPEEGVWRTAGDAFASYARRRRQAGAGAPRRLIADFFIGAHALAIGALITRDGAFFQRAFPEMRVIAV
jgi:predicted nucleic acid-binding protein